MSTDLVLSRGCRHTDWCEVPDTIIECCRSCGYAIFLSRSGRRPVNDLYADVQIQPRPQDTFCATRAPIFGLESYRYKALDYSQTRQIRVLVLKAGTDDDPLRCELQTVNLQQGPVYEALSYTWADGKGDDSLRCTIACHAEDDSVRLIAITANCESALRHYRSAKEDRRLWVDSICIDQSNVMERNHQVKNMIAIFRNAVRVLVFLGDGDPELDRLLEYMTNDVGGQLPRTTDFISLFRCRWFHRVWVLQEVAVAKSILVRYGNHQLIWEVLLQQGNLFTDIMASKRIPLMLPPVVSYALVQTNTGSRHLQDKSDLLALLRVSRNCSCKDPRDKVYAVMGLLKDESHLALSADYSAPVTSGWVFLQAAAWHISRIESLDILSQVEGTSGITMPSWVPDWTRKSPSSLPAQYKVPEVQLFAPRIMSRDGEVLVSEEGRIDYPLDCTLSVTGRKVGTVSMDHCLFGEALEDEYRSTENKLMESSTNTMTPPHWLQNPPRITRDWPAKLSVWARLLLLYPLAKSTAAEDVESGKVPVPASIPPAFGGPCQNCLIFDNMFSKGETYRRRADLHWKGRNVCDADEVENFLTTMYQYGTNRRLFATEHSLGLGPMDAQDRDEVWFLDGATVPFILRRVDDGSGSRDQYKLVGACHVHGLERNSDRCVNCKGDRVREEMSYFPGRGKLPQWQREQQWKLRKRDCVLQFKLQQQRELRAALESNEVMSELNKQRTHEQPLRPGNRTHTVELSNKPQRERELRLEYENMKKAKDEKVEELEQRLQQLEQNHKDLDESNEEQLRQIHQQLKQLEQSHRNLKEAGDEKEQAGDLERRLKKLNQSLKDLEKVVDGEKAVDGEQPGEIRQRVKQLNRSLRDLEKAHEMQLRVLEDKIHVEYLKLGKAKEEKLEFEQELHFEYITLEKVNEELMGGLEEKDQVEYRKLKQAQEEQLRELEQQVEQMRQIHLR